MENQLVFIKENIAVTDSLTIAEMFGKNHDNVLRDIRTQMEYAGENSHSSILRSQLTPMKEVALIPNTI